MSSRDASLSLYERLEKFPEDAESKFRKNPSLPTGISIALDYIVTERAANYFFEFEKRFDEDFALETPDTGFKPLEYVSRGINASLVRMSRKMYSTVKQIDEEVSNTRDMIDEKPLYGEGVA